MKSVPYLLLLALFFQSCSTKKPETTEIVADTVAIDSTQATSPAAAQLAFSPYDGFTPKKSLALPDTINYFLLTNQDNLKASFNATAATSGSPEFLINYVVAVAVKPTTTSMTIDIVKVETGESTIDVYLAIQRGEPQQTPINSARVFAIERRDGFPVMQFYVNGKKDKALVLVEAL